MSDRLQVPGKNALAGHFLDRDYHTPTLNGVIESSFGDRSGEAFKGRCCLGGATTTIDISSFAGVMTAFAKFHKDNLGELHVDNLTYDEYKDGKFGIVPVTVDGSKHIVIPDGEKFHGIDIYENGNFKDSLNCEDGDLLFVIGSVTGNLYPTSSNLHAEDSDVTFSFLNEYGYGTSATALVPIVIGTNLDILGAPATVIGKVKPKLQLVNSYCLEGNGTWSFDYGVAVTEILVGSVDVTGQCTIASGVVTPDNGLQLYDMTINGVDHYPCEHGIVLLIQSSNGGADLPITGGILSAVWGLQNFYHWNAIENIWQKATDPITFSTYKVDGTYIKFFGAKIYRKIPIAIESPIQFPDIPEINATGIDTSLSYPIQDLVDKNLPATFSNSESNNLGDILSYNRLIPGLFPCFDAVVGEFITFDSVTNWDSITHQGTGVFTLDLGNSRLECTSSGTIYNQVVYNADGEEIEWFLYADGDGVKVIEVIKFTNKGTLPNSTNWVSQKVFDYKRFYGCGTPLAFSIETEDSFTTSNATPSNRAQSRQYTTQQGRTYDFRFFETDLSNVTILDPTGEEQGWVNINGEDCLNMYADFTQSDVTARLGSQLGNISGAYENARFKLDYEVLNGSISKLEARDLSMRERFSAQGLTTYGVANIYAELSTIDILYKCLNGGADQGGGGYPNGIDDTYPYSIAGLSIANGYSEDVTSTSLRAMMEIDTFALNGTVPLLLEGLFNDADYQSGTAASSALTRVAEINPLPTTVGRHVFEGIMNDEVAIIGGLSFKNDTFITTYENVVEKLSTITFRFGSTTTETHFRFYTLFFEEAVEAIPAKFVGRLKRSKELVTGGNVTNSFDLKSTSDLGLKVIAYTKSKIQSR